MMNAPELPDAGAPPQVDGRWLRPVDTIPAEPRWGHPEGLQVGLHPLSGPRGLLRIYAPYLGHPRDRLVNFIAIEPIPAGSTERGYSELEHSALDDAPGKRLWAADGPESDTPAEAVVPSRGGVDVTDGIERLTVWVHCEPFENGARVAVRVRFRADRPREVALAAFAGAGSVPLGACVLTATMGNFARLRRLHLRDRIATPTELWPDFEGAHFADHARFGIQELGVKDGAVRVFATPDEERPADAVYADGTAEHWKYSGSRAAQGWRVDRPSDDLQVLVNGRWAYWASTSPIPGGVSFENFEIRQPFVQGQEATFWIEPFDSEPDLAGF